MNPFNEQGAGGNKRAFQLLHGSLEAYYAHWYHDRPIGITTARRDELRRLHGIVYRCIAHMAGHFEQYAPACMPLSDREMEILRRQSARPFRATTYRPDYLIDAEGRLLLCEITSRFFAHGIFMSYFSERVADTFMARFPGKTRHTPFEKMLDYMLEIVGNQRNIYVLKSADKTSEIRLYAPFYQHFGKRVEIIEAAEVERRRKDWQKGFVVSALNQRDLLSFSMDTVQAMIDAGMYNDFRTILLAHDKRFMRLWFEDAFTQSCLTREETDFLRAHAIPTFPWGTASEQWEAAREDREGYILKHHRLGKSEKVYAGVLTRPSDWEQLWTSGAVEDMILQPFIRQRTWPTVWQGTPYADYLCGMMLCVDDRYFDSGLFRASSLPVTNVGDDRKACPIHTDDADILAQCDVL